MARKRQGNDRILQETGKYLLIYGGLAAFGVAYNKAVEWIDHRQVGHPYTSFLVAAGTAVTIAATIPLIGRRCAAVVFGSFIAAGFPMIAGSIQRWIQRELRGQAVTHAITKEGERQKRTIGQQGAVKVDRSGVRFGNN